MKKLFLLLAIVFSSASFVYAQEEVTEEVESDIVDGIVAKQHIKSKRHLNPAYVREANVLWSKTVWRMIDLREKQNQRLYYPIQNTGDSRRSLVKVLLDAINDGKLQAFGVSDDDEFVTPISAKEVFEKVGGTPEDSLQVVNEETGESEWRYVYAASSLPTDEIYKFQVKEVWYFDRKYSRLDVRIIGLCPIREKLNDERTRRDQVQMFWVYFPHAEPFLSVQEAFNAKNDANRESILDVLIKREFSSYVFRESNVYNNRVIGVYVQGVSQNIEAERIQSSIFQKEHDMWEF